LISAAGFGPFIESSVPGGKMAGFTGVGLPERGVLARISDFKEVHVGTFSELNALKPFFSVTNQYAIGGCFEGIRFVVRDGNCVFVNVRKNFKRMQRSMTYQLIEAPPLQSFYDLAQKLFKANAEFLDEMERNRSWGYLRPWTEDLRQTLGVTKTHDPGLFMVFMKFQGYLGEPLHGFVMPYIRANRENDNGWNKVMANYLISMLAGEKAKEYLTEEQKARGEMATGLMLSDKEPRTITEWDSSNFLYIDNEGEWHSPREDDNLILPGITKGTIYKLLKEHGVEVQLHDILFEDVMNKAVGMVSMGTAAKLNRFLSLTEPSTGRRLEFDPDSEHYRLLGQVRTEFESIFQGEMPQFQDMVELIPYR
jgi:branched-subunit amino acid aminotransferase/4-amino-4-deoxychorismate lyase